MEREKVSQRIRKYMERRAMSLEDLAGRSGLDQGFLRTVLEEDVYPSLGPLLKIARALGVRLGTFLDDQVSEDPLIIRGNQRQEQLSTLRGKDRPVELKFYSLGKGKSDRHMEPFFVEIYPESAKEKKLSSHEGEEFIVVVSGQIEVIYAQEVHLLEPGDSIYYNSVVPHNVSSRGDEKATIYAVLYIPD